MSWQEDLDLVTELRRIVKEELQNMPPDLYQRMLGRILGLRQAASLVESHWNSSDAMVNQKDQAMRSARVLRLQADKYEIEAMRFSLDRKEVK